MVPLRPEEAWAQECLRSALPGTEVRQHDDGTAPGMHDLDLLIDGDVVGAVEVTGAVDQKSVRLWNEMNSPQEVRIDPRLVGGWMIRVAPNRNFKSLLAKLPDLLLALESQGRAHVDAGWEDMSPESEIAGAIGVNSARLHPTNLPGSMYFTIDVPMEKAGGVVPDNADVVSDWLGQWLREPGQRHNLDKLARSGARERHMFVLVPSFSVAPFAVDWALVSEDVSLPVTPPDLPPEVTHCWVASMWASASGFRWSPDAGWSRFSKAVASPS